MTRLILKFPVLAVAALCVVLAGCASEEDPGSKGGSFTTGGAGGAGAVGGTAGAAGAAGVGGTAGTAGVGGTAGTAGVGGAGAGGAAGDVGGAGGVAGMSMMSGGAGGMTGGAGGAGGATGGAGGTMSGGAGGMGGGGGTEEQCKSDFVAAGESAECAECACTMCAAELTACMDDALPPPNPNVTKTSGEVCQEIVECAGEAGCSGDACWCGCSGMGCCDTMYSMMGPCKFEINQGGSLMDMYGGLIAGPGQTHYPAPEDSNPGPGHPIGNANVVGACIADKCALCN